MMQLLQGSRLNAVQRRDPQHQLAVGGLRQQREDLPGLLGLEVRQDQSDDLWVLVADELDHSPWLHPLERLETLARASELDLIEHARSLVLTQCIDQRFTDEVGRSGA